MDLDNTTNITLRSSQSIPNIPFGICLLFLDLGIILGNCVTITVFRRNRTLRSPAGWIIVNIAACDLAIGVLVGVFAVPCVLGGYYPFHESIIQVEGALVLIFFDEAVYGLTLAAVDRYVAICRPYQYVRLFSDTNLLGVFVVTWLYAVLVPVVFTFTNGFKYYDVRYAVVPDLTANIPFSIYLICSTVGIGFGVIIFCYGRVWWEGHKKVNAGHVHSLPPNFTQQIKLASTLVLLTVLYVINYVGFVVVESMSIFGRGHLIPDGVYDFVFFCAVSNSFYNVVVYTLTYRPFRMAFLKTFFKQWLRNYDRGVAHAPHARRPQTLPASNLAILNIDSLTTPEQ